MWHDLCTMGQSKNIPCVTWLAATHMHVVVSSGRRRHVVPCKHTAGTQTLLPSDEVSHVDVSVCGGVAAN